MIHILWTLTYNRIFMKFMLFYCCKGGEGCGFHAYPGNHLSGLS